MIRYFIYSHLNFHHDVAATLYLRSSQSLKFIFFVTNSVDIFACRAAVYNYCSPFSLYGLYVNASTAVQSSLCSMEEVEPNCHITRLPQSHQNTLTLLSQCVNRICFINQQFFIAVIKFPRWSLNLYYIASKLNCKNFYKLF